MAYGGEVFPGRGTVGIQIIRVTSQDTEIIDAVQVGCIRSWRMHSFARAVAVIDVKPGHSRARIVDVNAALLRAEYPVLQHETVGWILKIPIHVPSDDRS